MAIPVFVINLARSTDRWAHMARQLGRHAAVVRVEAVETVAADGYGETSAPVPPHGLLGRPLSPGEIGCLHSHLRVLDRIVAENAPTACVLEDDVVLADDFWDVLSVLHSRRPTWDVVLLGHHSARRPPHMGAHTSVHSRRLTSARRVARVVEFPLGAYGYVVTARGARRLQEYARPFRMPMDWVTGYSPVAGIRLSAITPPCVVPDGVVAAVSTITDRGAPRSTATATPVRRGARELVGRAFLAARQAGLWTSGYTWRYRRGA